MRYSHLASTSTWDQDRIHYNISGYIHCILEITFNLKWILYNFKNDMGIAIKLFKQRYTTTGHNVFLICVAQKQLDSANFNNSTSCKISLLGPLNKIVHAFGFLHSVTKQKYLQKIKLV